MMGTILPVLASLLLFPGGLTVFLTGMAYEWMNRKLLARFQTRVGPRWFQPLADVIKLLAKEEVVPEDVHPGLFTALPVVALAGCLTAALYVPLWGVGPLYNFPGDLIVTLFLLSLLTLCLGIAGANTFDRFSLVGATRAFTQLFSYEAPFLLALLGPAFVAGSWQIDEIMASGAARWVILTQPIGFIVAVIGLIGKLELPPFDAPEAETEIVAGSLTEYSGRGLALFHMGKIIELVLGITLIAALYLGGLYSPLDFLIKTIALLIVIVILEALFARLRIDQSVGLWWRYGTLLVLLQWLGTIFWKGVAI
ncbi:MAG: NADH-quinone oxidoreductase subunit H [Anaerolineales bacterium]|nr:NADH-quinone oxidoreductase subunit H [Anaerolineales bacterium]